MTGGPSRFNQGRAQGLMAGSGLPRETFAATGVAHSICQRIWIVLDRGEPYAI